MGGFVAKGFEAVEKAFAENFASGAEVGAAFCAYVDGMKVADLHGGFTAPDKAKTFDADTLVNVWSTTKGWTAAVIAKLVEQGKLAYDRPVTDWWPEFGAHGKDKVTVAQLISHQAGVCGPREKVSVEDYYDHSKITTMLAGQEPFYPPGSATGYHAIVYGHLAGELVRRADGRTLGRFLKDEIAGPLGADIHVGLPFAEEPRCATMVKAPTEGPAIKSPNPAALRAAMGNPPLNAEAPNNRAWRAAEIPGANGWASARGVARFYAALALGGTLDGATILTPGTIAEATKLRLKVEEDLVLLRPMRWAAGFIQNTGGIYGPNQEAFGHSGWGGSVGVADPKARVSFSYVMNQMQVNLQGDPRSKRLIDALYAAL